LVTANEESVVVDWKKMVSERCLEMNEHMVSTLLFQAVMMPPLVPVASTQWKSFRFVGRKARDFAAEVSESLDSCRHTMSAREVVKVSRTVLHLSESPRPLTFQDRRE